MAHDFDPEGYCRGCDVHFLDAAGPCDQSGTRLDATLRAADEDLIAYIREHTDLAAVRARITGGELSC